MSEHTSTLDLQSRWSNSLMDNYGVPRIALVRGAGAVVTDADGKDYLDLLAGIAVNILGHAHPAVIEAVTTQLGTLGHTSNLYATEPGIELAEQLLAHLGASVHGRVFLCNSGTEANEAAFKIARLTGRPKIIAAEKAFHGRTMGALALTGQPDKRASRCPPACITFRTAMSKPSKQLSIPTRPLYFSNRSWGRAVSSFRRMVICSQPGRSPHATARC